MSMQASPMEDNSSLLQFDRQSMNGDGQVPGEKLAATAFFVLWGGVFLFLLVWLWLGVKSFLQSTLPDPGRQNQNNTPNVVDDVVPKLSRSQRRQRLVKYFDNGKQEVEVTDDILPETKDDTCESSDEETTKTDHDDDYDVESNEHLIHLKLSGSDSEKVFPNYCAICLENYKVGDHIVWSCNPECRHVFHRECLICGLVRIKDNTSPCPCCRMQFCDFPSTTPGNQDTISTSCES